MIYNKIDIICSERRLLEMIIKSLGYNCCQDSGFSLNFPLKSSENIMILLKDNAIFHINGNNIMIPENSVFIFKKCCQYPSENSFAGDWILFEFENNEEEIFFSLGLKYEQSVQMDNLCFLSFCIKSIAYEKYSGNINSKSSIQHYMFLMFNSISEQIHKKSVSPIKCDNYFEILSHIRNKIYTHPYEQMTIDSISHEVRMSKSNFQHLYKKYFNVTFIQDLINSRIEYAKMLLIHTNFNVSDIAFQCGYNNYIHFTKQFKIKTGMTPVEYRKMF